MKKEKGFLNLGAIGILLMATLLISCGISVYNSASTSVSEYGRNEKEYNTNSVYEYDYDYDLDDYNF